MTDVEIRRLSPEDWTVERDLRLAALADAPFAFGSRLADAELFEEGEWRRRIERQARFAALLDGVPVGTAGYAVGFEPFPADAALVVGVWVAPAARGLGVGDGLVGEVVEAVRRETHLGRLLLCVTASNEPADRLYRRHGFQPVDLGFPPDAGEIHMERPLDRTLVAGPG